MKKLLSIAMALVMILSLTVFVAADEVLLTEDIVFFTNGNWVDYETGWKTEDFLAAIGTPNAYLVITRSTPATADMAYGNTGYEKFCIQDSWWAGNFPVGDGTTRQWINLGTANHTIAATTEGGQPYDVDIDAVQDDGLVAWYEGSAILELWNAGAANASGANVLLRSNSSPDGVYDIVKAEVIVLDTPIAAPEAPAEEEAPADDTTEAAPATVVLGSYDLTADIASIPFALPEGLTLETGDVVTVHIKGTATNDKVRIYFTDNVDNGRVCEVVVIDVVDGAFETTVDITIAADGSIQGSAAPTILLVKGPSYGVNLTDVSIEVVEITSDKLATEAPVEEDTTTEDAPADEEPADTGLALAVVPAIVALAAVALSKKR